MSEHYVVFILWIFYTQECPERSEAGAQSFTVSPHEDFVGDKFDLGIPKNLCLRHCKRLLPLLSMLLFVKKSFIALVWFSTDYPSLAYVITVHLHLDSIGTRMLANKPDSHNPVCR